MRTLTLSGGCARACCFGILLISAGGCANLDVDVKMLDKSRVEAEQASQAASGKIAEVQQTIAKLPETATPSTDPSAPQSVITPYYKQRISESLINAADAQVKYRASLAQSSVFGDVDSLDEATGTAAREATTAINAAVSTANASGSSKAVAEVSAIKTAFTPPRSNLDSTAPFGKASNFALLPDASKLLYLPKAYWRRTVNRAAGLGAFGNVDIAVTASPTDGYTMKGVRVDSAKLIATTASLTRQLVAAVAAAYGIPTSFNNGSDGSTVDFNINNELNAAAKATAAAKTTDANRKAAAAALLKQIASKTDALTGANADDRKKAIVAIKAAFEAAKPTLGSPVAKTGNGTS